MIVNGKSVCKEEQVFIEVKDKKQEDFGSDNYPYIQAKQWNTFPERKFYCQANGSVEEVNQYALSSRGNSYVWMRR